MPAKFLNWGSVICYSSPAIVLFFFLLFAVLRLNFNSLYFLPCGRY
uniref:Uncharacterized protein n=1 Tax=Rhizophora mucronata TaxID=61149 RepID=A0A2P2NWM1_RHIMU